MDMKPTTPRASPSLRTLAFAFLGALALPALPAAWSQASLVEKPTTDQFAQSAVDRNSELKVVGILEVVQKVGGETFLWMKATDVTRRGFGAKPGHDDAPGEDMAWRVEGDGIGKIKEADLAKLVEGAKIEVIGLAFGDKTCKPACRIQAKSVRVR